jgi:four helix bundle protein
MSRPKIAKKDLSYNRFEEFPCWQKARDLCQAVYDVIQAKPFSRDNGLKDQIWKSAGQVMDNIAEGFDMDEDRGFIRCLTYAQRSCGEVQSQIYRALDCRYVDDDKFYKVYRLASECRTEIRAFRDSLVKAKE